MTGVTVRATQMGFFSLLFPGRRAFAGSWALRLWCLCVLFLALGCREDEPTKIPKSSETSAELRVVRRGVKVEHAGEEARAPYVVERLGDGAKVSLEPSALAWVRRDGGAQLLVRGPASLTMTEGELSIVEGTVFVAVPEGIAENLEVAGVSLTLASVKASLSSRGGETEVTVLQGEVTAGSTVAAQGQTMRLGKGSSAAKVTPTVTWEDWTGGLATTDPSTRPPPFGVGTVGARDPGSQGAPRRPLTVQRLDVRVNVVGDLAITEVDQTFFNPESRSVEGLYLFRTPENAVLERFGVDRGNGILYGYVKEQAAAVAQYQSHVYQGSTEDPALLNYRGPGEYEARLYPIGPGATRRVVVRYTEWLHRSGAKGERRLLTYPMAFEGSVDAAPLIEDLSIEVDLSRAGVRSVKSVDGAMRVGETVILRKHDLVPRADFSLELYDEGIEGARAIRAAHRPDTVVVGPSEKNDVRRTAEGEPDYLLVPLRVSDWAPVEAGLDVVLVVDTSAATDPAMLRVAQSAARAILTHLGDGDRAVVVAGDDRLRTLGGTGELAPIDDASRRAMIEGLSRVEVGGATDLATMLSQAAGKLGDKRRSAIVYIGDGASTVGESDLPALRERLKKAPRTVRTFGLGVGDGASLTTLAGLSTGGFAARVSDEETAARLALAVLERAERSVALGATVDLGPNVERIYPRDLGAFTEGESLFVIGRVTKDAPTSVSVKSAAGETSVKLAVETIEDQGDLRRRWAMGRLTELLESGAGRSAVVDLGVRQGIVTPFTSVYVPTTREMTPEQKASIDKRARKRKKLDVAEEEEGGERRKKGKLAEEKEASAEAAPNADGKTAGTRAKGEEGSSRSEPAEEQSGGMGKDGSYGRADKNKKPASAPPTDAVDQPMAAATAAASSFLPPEPAPAARPASPPSGGAGTNERLAGRSVATASLEPAAPGNRPDPNAGDGLRDEAGAPERQNAWGDVDGQSSQEAAQFGMIGLLNTEVPATKIFVIDDPGRVKRLCGAGASVPFEERKGLWRERLASRSPDAAHVVRVYKQAQALCEAPTMRERRALLLLGLDFLPTVAQRVQLYRLLAKDVESADVVYRGILARVSTTAQIRELNQALGVTTVDPKRLEQTIEESKDATDRLAKLKALALEFPDDMSLLLALLDAYEDAGDVQSGRLHAKALRKRTDADGRVRTAVGEFYLRLAKAAAKGAEGEDEAEARRAFGEIVEFAPEDPVARRRLGDLYRAHGYFAEATRQYETLARLVPDEPTVPLLVALSQNGLGKIEEAVRWTEKGQRAGAPDVAAGPGATARAMALLFLSWGRIEDRKSGNKDALEASLARTGRLLGTQKTKGRVRVVLSWSHPDLQVTMLNNGLGTMMPSSEGDATLGLVQANVPVGTGLIELKLEKVDLARAKRLGAKLRLTAVVEEGSDAEVIDLEELSFEGGSVPPLRYSVTAAGVEVAK
jgi:Ca-activated chloride channel family protein